MKQITLLIVLISVLMAGYTLAMPVPESLATMIFGIGLIGLATIGRKTLSSKVQQ
jgi:hypothetical protein